MEIAGTVVATSSQQQEAWSRREVPTVEQVSDDVWAVPVPVTRIPIRFTYAYVIRSGSDAVLIDPGATSLEGSRALTEGFAAIGMPLTSLTGIVVTHYHFDHWEAADDLAARTGAWIAIGAAEQAWVDALTDDAVGAGAATRRFANHGVPAARAAEFASLEDYRYTRDRMRPGIRLEHGDLLPVAGASLRVLSTPGHSPGHVCIHDEARGLLFSGDHILPGITPHIALNPFGAADPLHQYLTSLGVVEGLGDVEVLPAHEFRFRGLAARIAELRADLGARAREVAEALAGAPAAAAWDVASTLTWSRPWSDFGLEAQRMAVVETAAFLAHLRGN